MYDIIYDKIINARDCREDEGTFFLNGKGKVVEECDCFGKKVDTKLTHPEYCLVANETGCNTSMKKDGHVAGTRYITEKGTRTQHMASTSDGQSTFLPFLSANGQPVCYVMIFQLKCKEPKLKWGKGINIKVDPVRHTDGEIDFVAGETYRWGN